MLLFSPLILAIGVMIAVALWVSIKLVKFAGVIWWHRILAVATGGIVFFSMGGITWNAITFQLQRYSIPIATSGITSSGEFAAGVYADVTGAMRLTQINWGTLAPGQTGNATFYVKNEASVPIYCAISWIDSTWDPPAAKQYFTLVWNFGDAPLGVNRARRVTLQLKVSPSIQGITDFKFNMTVTAQDEPFLG